MRRSQVALKSAAKEVGGSTATTNVTVDYVSFGRVPKIAPPDPDEVFDVTSEIESNLQAATEGH